MPSTLKFTNAARSTFFATVRERVDAYFQSRQLSRHANGAMWAKTLFFLFSFVGLYSLILFGSFGPWELLGLAGLLGACCAFIGFNICHDAMHGGFSANKRVNRVFSLLFNLIGANPYVWTITHNIVHHTYTNIPGHDEDIEVAPGLIRLCAEEPIRPWQRYQHLYAFPLYGLASLSWVLRKDYLKFFKDRIGQHPTPAHPRKEYINLFAYKALYYLLFIVVPLLVLDVTWWQVALGFLGMHFVEGLVLGLVFQLAHVVEGTAFPLPDEAGDVQEAWAVHQLQTTANFSPNSALVAFLCGGLNRQIEHHLFPRICHIHYPALSGIVRQTALEFGLPYLENPSFAGALQSHYRMLRKLGR
ncbi:fatty acid desaturase family protein [Hymenobacter psychrotolerans]|uniref:Linoleoyl-CoA desaturase n=1 Tax=Hymenobacter psychrotolerans DSM 18569 TaxID=1121959 RepID=A0A1M6XVN9_9BACT|nr:acyl-CoA desaturase [Hymenobacter psychrotolerans]SHL10044.1 linoleoyl-CoA desaturase [Hymenobacter psychrotolerans DSM 18569]